MKIGELKNYKLIKKVGWGGMGLVYIAEDLALGRKVAIKFLAPHLVQDREFMERFRAEARNQARLAHPNITMVYAFQETEDQAFLVLEYIDGETLENCLKRQGRLTVPEALSIFRSVLNAVEYAHSRGIIHRDLKPGNIALTTERVVKVMDFGIALNLEESSRLTRTGHMLGSPYYMAPEQILAKQTDLRTDIYALGITLYEMLTGNPPFAGLSDYEVRVAQINQVPPTPRSLGFTDIHPALEQVIMKAMAKDPGARFANATEFLQAIEAVLLGESPRGWAGQTAIDKSTLTSQYPLPPAELQPVKKPLSQKPGWLTQKYRLLYIPVLLAVLVAVPLIYLGLRGISTPPASTVSHSPPKEPQTQQAPAAMTASPLQERRGEEKKGTPVAAGPPQGTTTASAKAEPSLSSLADQPSPQQNTAPRPSLGREEKPPAVTPLPGPTISQKPSASAGPVETAALPQVKTPKTPDSKAPNDMGVLQAIKNKLTQSGFPQIEVFLDSKGRINITGRLKKATEKKQIVNIVDAVGHRGAITYDLTLIKEKPPRKAKKRTGQEAPEPVIEAPARPLPPKFD